MAEFGYVAHEYKIQAKDVRFSANALNLSVPPVMQLALRGGIMHFGMKLFVFAVSALVLGGEANAQTFGEGFPAKVQARVKTDLEFVQTLAGKEASPLHQKIFGAVDGAGYLNWFNSRIDSFEYDADRTDGAVAYVSPMMSSSTMFVTNYFVESDHPQIARLMVMFHEARHTESSNGFWMHADCPDPFLDDNGQEIKSIWTGLPLAGKPGCDSTPIGAYGSSLIMLKNVQKFCNDCSSKVKMDAGIYADDQVNRVIDKQAKQKIKNDLYAVEP